jgi:hypothetical protein
VERLILWLYAQLAGTDRLTVSLTVAFSVGTVGVSCLLPTLSKVRKIQNLIRLHKIR